MEKPRGSWIHESFTVDFSKLPKPPPGFKPQGVLIKGCLKGFPLDLPPDLPSAVKKRLKRKARELERQLLKGAKAK